MRDGLKFQALTGTAPRTKLPLSQLPFPKSLPPAHSSLPGSDTVRYSRSARRLTSRARLAHEAHFCKRRFVSVYTWVLVFVFVSVSTSRLLSPSSLLRPSFLFPLLPCELLLFSVVQLVGAPGRNLDDVKRKRNGVCSGRWSMKLEQNGIGWR